MKIVLTGPKCSGKSTVGRMLAEKLVIPFFETDELIEELYLKKTEKKLTCRSICSEIGDDGFRELERKVIDDVQNLDWCIVSTGGSTMLNSDSRQILRKDSILILLYASLEVLLERLNKKKIPAFLNNIVAVDLFSERAKLMIDIIKPYSDISCDSSGFAEEEVLAYIIDKLNIELNIWNSWPNSIGQFVRLTTFGESHGKALGAVLDGVKPGIEISEEIIQKELNRRRPGQSALSTSRNEKDKIKILSGVFEGKTTGTPIGMIIENQDQDSSKYERIKDVFRPGTADFTFWQKYSIRDHRGAGRASGRETVSRVMGGAIAKSILQQYGIKIIAHTVSIAGINAEKCDYELIEKNDVRCGDLAVAVKMEKAILDAKKDGDSVGGIVQIEISGVPAGIGDPVFGKLDARLGMAILSIGAIKGIEFGNGFSSAQLKGSENNDSMENGKFLTNNGGGILGGISTGEKIVIRAAVKPTPSIYKKQNTCGKKGENVDILIEGRHDPCIVPRIIPVMESMAALVILDALELQRSIKPDF